MRRGIFGTVFLSLLFVSLDATASFATRKRPGTATERANQCDAAHLSCLNDCDDIIDIGTAVRDCKNRCDIKHARCMKRAQTMETPIEGDTPTGELTISPE